MKTICILDLCGQERLQFFVLDGDYSHLNNVYLNGDASDSLIDELTKIVYDDKGTILPKMYKKFPMKTAQKPDTKVIIVGFYP